MDPQHMDAASIGLIFTFIAVAALVMTVVMTVPYWVIFRKAGFSPWLSLLLFVPLANIVILYVVAFSEWKVVPVASLGYPPPPMAYPPAPPSLQR